MVDGELTLDQLLATRGGHALRVTTKELMPMMYGAPPEEGEGLG